MPRSSESYANDLRLSREAKQRRRGLCENCGTETRYNGRTVNGPSRLCKKCAEEKNGLAKRGTGPLGKKVLQFCSQPRHFMEISHALDIPKETLATTLNRLHNQYGLLDRPRRGVYVRRNP